MSSDRFNNAELDLLDLIILEKMLEDGRITFKELAKQTHSDQRTIASRYQRLIALGVIEAPTIHVNWSKIGLGAMATIGTTTRADEANRKKLLDFIKHEPRVLEAFSSIGFYEYTLRVVDKDIATLRNELITPLEPLTAGLHTSISIEKIKSPDYKGLLRKAKIKLQSRRRNRTRISHQNAHY